MWLAGAAWAHPQPYLADVLWAVTFFAVIYALILAIFARGQLQTAAGFVLASAAFVVCAIFAPGVFPTHRVFSWVLRNAERAQQYFHNSSASMAAYLTSSDVVATKMRTVFAASTILAGHIGCALGALAARHAGAIAPYPPRGDQA
jgi:hypothetical protein